MCFNALWPDLAQCGIHPLPSGAGRANCVMTGAQVWVGRFSTFLLLGAMITDLGACASKPKPDWDQRVGHYTFDQAVQEFGPPASSIRLQDGTTVAEWFLKAGPQFSFGLGTGFASGPVGVGVGQGVTTPPKGHFLRLTFGPDGQLRRWEKVTH